MHELTHVYRKGYGIMINKSTIAAGFALLAVIAIAASPAMGGSLDFIYDNTGYWGDYADQNDDVYYLTMVEVSSTDYSAIAGGLAARSGGGLDAITTTDQVNWNIQTINNNSNTYSMLYREDSDFPDYLGVRADGGLDRIYAEDYVNWTTSSISSDSYLHVRRHWGGMYGDNVYIVAVRTDGTLELLEQAEENGPFLSSIISTDQYVSTSFHLEGLIDLEGFIAVRADGDLELFSEIYDEHGNSIGWTSTFYAAGNYTHASHSEGSLYALGPDGVDDFWTVPDTVVHVSDNSYANFGTWQEERLAITSDGKLDLLDNGISRLHSRHRYVAMADGMAIRSQNQYWPGDLNEDLVVDITDLNMVLAAWGKTPNDDHVNVPLADTNLDGIIDITDLNTVLIDWGKTGFKQ